MLVLKINPLQQEQVVVACTKQGRWVDKAGKLTIDVSTLITNIAAASRPLTERDRKYVALINLV